MPWIVPLVFPILRFTITKNIFFNDFVVSKSSGSVSYIPGHRLYLCIGVEYYILDWAEHLLPGLQAYTGPAWDLCRRPPNNS